MPYEAGVEVPVLIDRSGIHPCRVGSLPAQLAALNQTNLNVQQLIAHSIMAKDRELAIQAVMLDPLTAAVLSLADIEAMFDEMWAAHGDRLAAYS